MSEVLARMIHVALVLGGIWIGFYVGIFALMAVAGPNASNFVQGLCFFTGLGSTVFVAHKTGQYVSKDSEGC